ncbi:MAG TPA: amidohydrolase family protein [Bryobacteraceae bacterium]|nr:amidohydrolase family protein [Bryobacteraceae bacterium]
MNMRRSGAAALVLFFAGSLFGEVKVFENFTLIDGTGRQPVGRQAMIVDNGRIRWVGPEAQLQMPAGAERVDLAGKYVMPGLIDLHCHLGDVVGMTQDAKFFTRENVEHDLKTYASYGVTTVLSMGTEKDSIFQMRAEQRAGRPRVARIYTAGQGFVYKGSYGGLAGVTPQVSNAAEVDAEMNKLAADHVDIVKFWIDDHNHTFKIKMPYSIAKAIIDSAHRHHLRVTAHVFYLADAKAVVNDGVDALAHEVRDQPVDQELIDSMKKHGTWQQASTLYREESLFIYGHNPKFLYSPFFTRGVSENVIKTLRSAAYQKSVRDDPEYDRYPGFFEMAKRNLKTLADAGIPYGTGTDAGPPGRFPGYSEQRELQLMVDAGLTPMQVIVAATRSGAEFLGAKDLGTIAQGKWADLLILNRNPVENIGNTEAINAVYIAGNRVN